MRVYLLLMFEHDPHNNHRKSSSNKNKNNRGDDATNDTSPMLVSMILK